MDSINFLQIRGTMQMNLKKLEKKQSGLKMSMSENLNLIY